MNPVRDSRTRIVLSWLREDAHENAEPMLLRALDEVDATPQRRSSWPAWRSNRMNIYAKLVAAAIAVVAVAVIGYRFLPTGAGIGAPAVTPAPSPTLLARGDFHSKGIAIHVDATRVASHVTGVMTWDFGDARVSANLECTRTTVGGLIVIGGEVTESTHPEAPKGSRVAIVFERGSPVRAHPHTEGEPRAASCLAALDGVTDAGSATVLEPIEGSVELGP